MSFLKILEKCPEWRTISPMPPSTRSCTFSTTSSETSSWAMCPHQRSTSVLLNTSSESPCSGSSRVAVPTSKPPSLSAAASTACMPSGYIFATCSSLFSCLYSFQIVTRGSSAKSISLPSPVFSIRRSRRCVRRRRARPGPGVRMVRLRNVDGPEALDVGLVFREEHFELVHALEVEGDASFGAVDLEGVLVPAARREARGLEGADGTVLEARQEGRGVVHRYLSHLGATARRERPARAGLLQGTLLYKGLRHACDLGDRSDYEVGE